MQQVFTVWDDGTSNVYGEINAALKRGAHVVASNLAGVAQSVSVGEMAEERLGAVWVVATFVLEGTDEQLGIG